MSYQLLSNEKIAIDQNYPQSSDMFVQRRSILFNISSRSCKEIRKWKVTLNLRFDWSLSMILLEDR